MLQSTVVIIKIGTDVKENIVDLNLVAFTEVKATK